MISLVTCEKRKAIDADVHFHMAVTTEMPKGPKRSEQS